MFWGLVIMLETGAAGAVVDEVVVAVESVVLSLVVVWLLLHALNDNNSAPKTGAQRVRAEIIFVVFKINKCGAEEVNNGYELLSYA